MTIESRELLLEDHGRTRILTLNRPHRKNALSSSLRHDLLRAFVHAKEEPDVWAILLTGAGDSFCAGGDVKEKAARDKSNKRALSPDMGTARNLLEVIATTYKPTICAINGDCVGGGFELALACDIRLAAAGARLGLPEAKLGLGANFASVMLRRAVPTAIAYQMLYTGEFISAEDGERWGLINRVAEPDHLASCALEFAGRIVHNSPITLRRMKHTMVKSQSLSMLDALQLDAGPNPYTSEDRKEGIRAFSEKRKPDWRNC